MSTPPRGGIVARAFDMLNTMESETFGHRLKRLRDARGLSQRKLATAAGLTNGAISQAEHGKLWVDQAPSYDIVRRLAAALGVTSEELTGGAAPPGEPPDGPRPDRPRLGPDAAYNRGVIVEYIESWPDPIFHERLMREKEARTPESYARLCLRTFALWSANFNGVLETAEEMRGEVYDQAGEDDGERS
jgi:transcriptional regulator with XRE-family HTH domain